MRRPGETLLRGGDSFVKTGGQNSVGLKISPFLSKFVSQLSNQATLCH